MDYKKKRQNVKRRRRQTKPYAKKNIRFGGLIGLEQKFCNTQLQHNISRDISGARADGANECLNNVPQGSGAEQRNGLKYAIHSLHVDGVIEFGASTFAGPGGGLSPVGRVMLVIDHQNNAATTFNPADVWYNPGTAANTVFDVFAKRNVDNMPRFTVLMDKILEAGPRGLAWDGTNYVSQAVSKYFSYYKVFKKPIIVHHSVGSTGGGIQDIRDNCFHICALAQDTGSILTWKARIRYTDL